MVFGLITRRSIAVLRAENAVLSAKIAVLKANIAVLRGEIADQNGDNLNLKKIVTDLRVEAEMRARYDSLVE